MGIIPKIFRSDLCTSYIFCADFIFSTESVYFWFIFSVFILAKSRYSKLTKKSIYIIIYDKYRLWWGVSVSAGGTVFFMSQWDKDYLGLCKKILTEGTEVTNRTGTNSIKVPSHHFYFDLREEFPILTTKQLFIRQAVLEMLWIYQAQSNDVRWLQERNVKIWNEWEIDEDGIWTATQLLPDENGKLTKQTVHKNFGKEYAHTIGTAYGYIVNKFQMTQKLIDTIKNNPRDRRMIMTLWQNDYLDTAVLPSCVWSSEWDVTNGYLNCWVHQRSCDVPLGLPFNVTQYAVLLCMLAQVTGLKPGTMDWSIKDPHIYVNQVDGIKEQLRRFEENGDYPAPKLWLNPEVDDFFKFDNSKDLNDVKLIDYKHMGKIKFPISQ